MLLCWRVVWEGRIEDGGKGKGILAGDGILSSGEESPDCALVHGKKPLAELVRPLLLSAVRPGRRPARREKDRVDSRSGRDRLCGRNGSQAGHEARHSMAWLARRCCAVMWSWFITSSHQIQVTSMIFSTSSNTIGESHTLDDAAALLPGCCCRVAGQRRSTPVCFSRPQSIHWTRHWMQH